MALELIKEEVLKEMDSVQHFIRLAISAQECGYTKAAQYFLSEAREDCEHAFLYAQELDKHSISVSDHKNIIDITKAYCDMEHGAIDRITAMHHEAKTDNMYSARPFISQMMLTHMEDYYRAKKMLQKIEVLFSADSLSDIEDIFEDEADGGNDD